MDETGLIDAFLLDGPGSGTAVDWQEIESWAPDQGVLWIHLSYASEYAKEWLQEKSGLDAITCEAMISEETRPRTAATAKGVLLTLRGANMNPDQEVEDMVSLRIWAEERRIITIRKRKLNSITDIALQLKSGRGPTNCGQFINSLTDFLTSYIELAIGEIDEKITQVEETVMFSLDNTLRSEISSIRRQAILFRRYLAPQRDALSRLQIETISWFSDRDRRVLHEITDSLIRIIENLDSIKDRANVAREELVTFQSERLNSKMYILSLFTAIFLPLGFLTGLLGINVGGIPGSSNKWAFFIVTGVLLLVSAGQFLLFRWKRWL